MVEVKEVNEVNPTQTTTATRENLRKLAGLLVDADFDPELADRVLDAAERLVPTDAEVEVQWGVKYRNAPYVDDWRVTEARGRELLRQARQNEIEEPDIYPHPRLVRREITTFEGPWAEVSDV